jgi:hypothetical protein
LAFGTSRTTASTDYTRGSSNGGVSTGGVYAFNTTTGNASLGFQPGGSDWAPGTVTLKIQNQTGALINAIDMAYKLYVLNDQGRSSSFNCSWSTDNTNFTDLVSLNYTSPATADAAPAWNLNERSATISNLSIAPGAFFYLRWSGADAGGTGTRDEFALDDIAVTLISSSPVTLPVTLSDFTAATLKDGIELDWSNLTETNIESYVVEHSANGNVFQEIGSRLPLKNDGARVTYSLFDSKPVNGWNFYRIKSIEAGGTINYSQVVKLVFHTEDSDFRIFPNPVTGGYLSIQLGSLPPGTYRISVYNFAGQVVGVRKIEVNSAPTIETIPVSGYKPGTYIIRLSGPTEKRGFFVKQ